MLKGVGFKLQVQVDCKKGKSHSAKLIQSGIRLDRSRIAKKWILQNFKSSPSPWKHLEFHSNLSICKRETLATFFKLLEDLFVTLCEIWEVLYLLTTQAVVESSYCYKINYWSWFETFVWDLKVISMGACVIVNRRREGVCEFGTCTWSCQ